MRDVIQCREPLAWLPEKPLWKPGTPALFQYMPSGVHTITAGFRNKAVRLTVLVDQSTADTVQASFEEWKSRYPKQKPFCCVEHEERAASVWPIRFEWGNGGEPGVYCLAEPSDLGAAEVNGKVRRSFSPSFTTDADYASASDNGSGVLVFPPGTRGSEANPARVTGIAFCCGTLTNKPAFKAMSPVRAREAGEFIPGAQDEARAVLNILAATQAEAALILQRHGEALEVLDQLAKTR